MYTLVRAIFGYGEPIDADIYNNAIKDIKEIVKIINNHLQGKKNLVAEHITVADIAVAVMLIPVY